MNIATSLLALALMGGNVLDNRESVADTPVQVRYEVTILKFKGLDWRSSFQSQLETLDRQGAATVWSAKGTVCEEMAKLAESATHAPSVNSRSDVPVTIKDGITRRIAAGVKRVADGPINGAHALVFLPDFQEIAEGLEAVVTSKQGEASDPIPTRIALSDVRIATIHNLKISEDVLGSDEKNASPTTLSTHFQVPEMVEGQVSGEFPVKNGEVLVVSFGPYTTSDAQGKAVTHDRVVVIAPRRLDGNAVPVSTAPRAVAVDKDLVCVESKAEVAPLAKSPAAAKRDSSPKHSVRLGVLAVPQPHMPVPWILLSLNLDADCGEAIAAMPKAPTPPRSMPTPISADGKVAALPEPNEDDTLLSANEETDETRPAPQAKHVAPGSRSIATHTIVELSSPVSRIGQTQEKTTPITITRDVMVSHGPGTEKMIECDNFVLYPARKPEPEACEDEEKAVDQVWNMTLNEAIRIAFKNSETVASSANAMNPKENLRIAPRDPRMARANFSREASALARSVEQQFWALGLAHTRFWASETALFLEEQVLRREHAKAISGAPHAAKNLEVIQERLERSRRRHADATAEMIDTEHDLKRILNVSPGESRRIVPASSPREDEVHFNPRVCFQELCASHPDLAGKKLTVLGAAVETILNDREEKVPSMGIAGRNAHDDPAATKAIRSLGRMLMECDGEFRQFRLAIGQKEAAKKKLDTLARSFDAGKTPVGRYLDGIEGWMTAVIHEADTKACYNTAIAAVEEMKGTLLAKDGLNVVTAHEELAATRPTKVDSSILRSAFAGAMNAVGAEITPQLDIDLEPRGEEEPEEGPALGISITGGAGASEFDSVISLKAIAVEPITFRIPASDGSIIEIQARVVKKAPGK